MAWENRIIVFYQWDADGVNNTLAKWGQQGWEIVSVTEGKGQVLIVALKKG